MQAKHALWLLFILLSASVEPCLAVVRPAQHSLEGVEILVNGKSQRIGKDQTLELVWGDRLQVKAAYLSDAEASVDIVNLVGYRAQSGSADDRGTELQSDRELNRDWSHDGSGRLFRVNVRNKDQFFGRVYLHFSDPELVSVDLEINGKTHRYMAHDDIRLKKSDRLRLASLQANFPFRPDEISYEIKPEDDSGAFLLLLFRHDQAFARLRMLISPP